MTTRSLADADEAARSRLERDFLDHIPLTRAMGLRVAAYDGASLTLAAPLTANINDKGCAFGGSLTSLMTLAGWGLVKLALDAQGTPCDIYVRDSHVRYLAPVWQDFTCTARPAEGQHFDSLFAALAARGKGRLRVQCEVPAEAGPAATLEAQFVAIATKA